MTDQAPQISVVIPVHSEEHWAIRAMRSVFKQIEAPPYELIVVVDKAADNSTNAICEAFKEAPEGVRCQPVTIDAGSLGAARNAGLKMARGRFVTFLDADDLLSPRFLRQAFEAARRYDHDRFVIHQEFSVMFGVQNFMHRHFSSTDPCFDERDIVQFNPWSALLFAHKSLFEDYPYTTRQTYEDWDINTRMLGDGVEFHCAPGTCKFIRMKLDETSLAARLTVKKSWLAPMKLFDKRANIKIATHEQVFQPPDGNIIQEALYVHHEVGEHRLTIDPQPQLRIYPRQVIWDDQAFLRDAIGSAQHVVLVQELKPGGAEKYAMDYADALRAAGESVVIVETAPGASPWRNRATVPVVPWIRRRQMDPPAHMAALQRALLQARLQSVFVCNSEIGWAILHENPAAIAKRVLAASFSTFLVRGFSSCPPFYLKRVEADLTIVTDNERHARRLKDYGVPASVAVLRPKCTASGRNMRRQVFNDSDRIRVLWAGRGTYEKRPDTAALVAAAMPEVDMHIWGDVQQIAHALPNLKYRGPFESWDKIDGSYDMYLITSETEGMPNTALEAASSGLPIVSSDVGDISILANELFPAPVARHAHNHVQNACAAIARQKHRAQNLAAKAMVEQWANEFNGAVVKLAMGEQK